LLNVLIALPVPAQFTAMRSGPSFSAASSAAVLSARVEQSFRGGRSQPGCTTGHDGDGVFDLH
jgi:hypothetical protein